MEYYSKSAEETKAIGKRFSADLKPGNVIALTGELGAGKTTFIQGFAEGIGINARIISPTFIIMREYQTSNEINFYHIDLYRLENNLEAEIENLGLTDVIEKAKDIMVIEWAEKIKDLLPSHTIWVNIESLNGNERKININ